MKRALLVISPDLQGAVIFWLLVAGIMTLVAGLVLVQLYRRAVERGMKARSGPITEQAGHHQQAPPPPRRQPSAKLNLVMETAQGRWDTDPSPSSAFARRAHLTAAGVHTVAGLVHAAIATILLFTFAGFEFLPMRTMVVVWAFAWPVVLTLILLWGPDRTWQLGTILGYFVPLLAVSMLLAALGVTSPLGVGDMALPAVAVPLFLWLMYAAPTSFLLVFLNRRIRAVGPLLLVTIAIGLFGAHLANVLMMTEQGLNTVVAVAWHSGIGITTAYFGTQFLGFALFLVAGWFVALWIRKLYEAKRVSEQTIMFDSIWLLMTLFQCSGLTTEQGVLGWLGFLAFGGYKLVLFYGLRPLQRTAAGRNTKLLLLRVFGAQKRSEWLFDLLSARWRYAGSIQLIAGTDLATTTIEPHEFLDFLSGRLRRSFIRSVDDLNRRMAALDLRPDSDGRFRVNDFFCSDDTWQMTVTRLIGDSGMVVMDLRSFSPENKGCIFELQALIDGVRLDRVVLLIDGTTDLSFLQNTLFLLWERMSGASPNLQGDAVTLRLLRIEGRNAAGVSRLLRICDRIMHKAEAAGGAGVTSRFVI